VLQERGARIVFVVEKSFTGTLEAQGFEEVHMRLKPKPEVEEEPGQFWKDFIRETAPQFRKPTIDQLETLILPIWQELVDGACYADERLSEIFAELEPDVIVQDNVVAFPAVPASEIPWVRIVSCNPLELKDPELPPTFSGLPARERSEWAAFRRHYRGLHNDLQHDFSAFCVERGAPPLPEGEFIHESPQLNLYLYPEEADYRRSRPLGPTWHRLNSCVRGASPWQPPHGSGKLVYLSLGSLGSGDVELMTRLIGLLGEVRHRVVVSMGPQHEQLALADNMVGAEFLPQPSVLPHADLVITHGGNNTVTECFHFGKPMVALPLFWDQYDNAERVDELGFGIRLPPYDMTDAEFHGAIGDLLGDAPLRKRMRLIARRLQATPGTTRAADLIERVATSSR
jgi:MGT family glycosyltransferase